MATIVSRIKEKIESNGDSTAGIQTISQAIKVLGGGRKDENIAEAIRRSNFGNGSGDGVVYTDADNTLYGNNQ